MILRTRTRTHHSSTGGPTANHPHPPSSILHSPFSILNSPPSTLYPLFSILHSLFFTLHPPIRPSARPPADSLFR